MSIYSNVTEQDLENLRKLAEKQKEQRALKIKNRILKQTHDIKLAESLSPITKKLDEVRESTKDSLDTINENTQKVGDIIKGSNSEIIPSTLLQDTFKSLTNTTGSLKLTRDKNGNMSILNTPIKSLGGDKIRVYDNIYEFNPEIHKALSKSSYTGKSMKNEDDRRTLYNFLTDIGYNTHNGDISNSQKKFFTRLFNQFENIKKEELDGQGVKIIIPSNIIDIYTRLEVLLGLKLSGHTNTLTEASN